MLRALIVSVETAKLSAMFLSEIGEVVTALGGEALFLAAAGWLVKTLISHRLTKEADEFKTELQSRADQFKVQLQSNANVEIERLKASLQLVATEHQIRFAKLHEKRALVIAELYTHLVEAPAHAGKFIFQNVRDAEEAAKANTKMLELYRFINLNRIYFPEAVCGLLDKFESTVRKSVLTVDIYWTRIEYPNAATREEQNKVMLAACSALESDLPALLKEVEREFRNLLGGS
jgi:hypothetical protein